MAEPLAFFGDHALTNQSLHFNLAGCFPGPDPSIAFELGQSTFRHQCQTVSPFLSSESTASIATKLGEIQ
jgi:hypothetical protein